MLTQAKEENLQYSYKYLGFDPLLYCVSQILI